MPFISLAPDKKISCHIVDKMFGLVLSDDASIIFSIQTISENRPPPQVKSYYLLSLLLSHLGELSFRIIFCNRTILVQAWGSTVSRIFTSDQSALNNKPPHYGKCPKLIEKKPVYYATHYSILLAC